MNETKNQNLIRKELYLHGDSGASCLDFVNQAKALSEKMKIIIFDQLGVLRSEVIAENENYSMEYQIEMLEEMRKFFGIEKSRIVCIILK